MVYFARQDKMLTPLTGEMIKNVRILVVGVGAGGNESAKNLVLMGFGNITVVDLDLVEDFKSLSYRGISQGGYWKIKSSYCRGEAQGDGTGGCPTYHGTPW